MLASGTIIANANLEALSEDSQTNGFITTERSHFYVINENSFGKMDMFSSLLKEIIYEESEGYIKQFRTELFWLYVLGNFIVILFGWNNVFIAWRVNNTNDYR